jgi:hypothetical protein
MIKENSELKKELCYSIQRYVGHKYDYLGNPSFLKRFFLFFFIVGEKIIVSFLLGK